MPVVDGGSFQFIIRCIELFQLLCQQSTTCQKRPINRPIKEQKRPTSTDVPRFPIAGGSLMSSLLKRLSDFNFVRVQTYTKKKNTNTHTHTYSVTQSLTHSVVKIRYSVSLWACVHVCRVERARGILLPM